MLVCFLFFKLVFGCFFLFALHSKMGSIILKKVGRIGGDEKQVKSRLRHILSAISKSIDFSIAEVKTRGAGHLPPIYEVCLEDPDSASALRKAYTRFTRKKDPVSRPPELDGVEVYNSISLATRVRISILRVSCLRSLFWLISFVF